MCYLPYTKGRVAIQAVISSSSADINKSILQYVSIFPAFLQTAFIPHTMRQTSSNEGESVAAGHERHMYLSDPLSLQHTLFWLLVFDALFFLLLKYLPSRKLTVLEGCCLWGFLFEFFYCLDIYFFSPFMPQYVAPFFFSWVSMPVCFESSRVYFFASLLFILV